VRLRAGLEAVEETLLSLTQMQPKFGNCPGSIIVTSLAVFPVVISGDVFSAAKFRSSAVQHVVHHFNVLSIQAQCY
jgi:hypothetical protein